MNKKTNPKKRSWVQVQIYMTRKEEKKLKDDWKKKAGELKRQSGPGVRYTFSSHLRSILWSHLEEDAR